MTQYLVKIAQLGLKYNVLLWLAIIFYFSLVWTDLSKTQHVLFNLEPYPDGLYYVLSGRNFVFGKGLKLVYQDYSLSSPIPLFYPLVLAIAFLVNTEVSNFVIINWALGLLTITALYFLLKKITNNFWAINAGMVVYLSSGLIYILPELPMIENLSVALFVLSLYFLIDKHKGLGNVLAGLGFAFLLILSKYSVVLVGASLIGLFFLKAVLSHSKRTKMFFLIGLLLLYIISSLVMSFYWKAPHILVRDLILRLIQPNQDQFYSLTFIVDNLKAYFMILIGNNPGLLWFNEKFFSFFVTSLLPLSFFLGFKHKNWFWKEGVILILFLSQFLLMSVFYVVDVRYIVYTFPLLAVSAAQVTYRVIKTKQLGWLMIIGFLITAHLFSQLPIFKLVIANNKLYRSRAWQYEAIKSFDSFFTNQQPATLITALPPFLVNAYQTTEYQLLPLSHKQEFLAKKQYVWGTNIDYDDLIQEYTIRLKRGELVYISNAYITHQWEVIQDYETIKIQFTFTQVATGCENACNLYQLSLPIKPTNPESKNVAQ